MRRSTSVGRPNDAHHAEIINQDQANQVEDNMAMEKWECSVCGYVYDPAKGDPESGVPPGTPFESLPDDWECPICGAMKSQFEKLK